MSRAVRVPGDKNLLLSCNYFVPSVHPIFQETYLEVPSFEETRHNEALVLILENFMILFISGFPYYDKISSEMYRIFEYISEYYEWNI